MAKGKYAEWLSEDGLLKLQGWARDGLTDEQIAQNMGINVSTLYVYKNKYAEIAEALKRGKEVVDREVENALLKRALGYSFQEVTETETDKGTEVKTTYKQMAPDVTAIIFWLKNRKPKDYRDKQEIEVSTNGSFAEMLKAARERGEKNGEKDE